MVYVDHYVSTPIVATYLPCGFCMDYGIYVYVFADGSSPCSSSEADEAVVVGLAVVLAIALVGLLVLSLLTCYYFRRRRPNQSNDLN